MNADGKVPELRTPHFEILSKQEGRALVSSLVGNADGQAQEDLFKFLNHLDSSAKELKVTEVILELRELYFMNSSCLTVLMRWITTAKKERAYTIRFRSNPNLRWQRRSLQALSSMAEGIVTVD